VGDVEEDFGGRGSELTRRGAVLGALVGSLGGAGLAAPVAAAASAAASSSTAGSPSATQFFADPEINLQILFAMGGAAYGASELGEMLTAVDEIRKRGSSYRAVYETFIALGRRLRQRGDDAARRGRKVTARDSYLRAAMYLDQALFFTLASTMPTRAYEGRVYREMEGCFANAGARFDPAWKQVAIPYGRRTLPGWLLTPPGPRIRRPTVILNNGSDGQNIDSFVYGGAAALQRGWNALIFEGPGQGANLFLHNIFFLPQWERVITPVVSWLRGRPEVDRRRIILSSQSFGGLLVLRAAAYEHRLAAVISDPGVHDAFVDWTPVLRQAQVLTFLLEGKRQQFDPYWNGFYPHVPAADKFTIAKRSEIYGNGSFYERMRNARLFKLSKPMVRRITAPTVVASPDAEASFPGQPKTVYEWLHPSRRALIRFTAAEGAQLHCEPMAPTLRNDTLLDWVEANLRPTV
jgi:hypothetical protein